MKTLLHKLIFTTLSLSSLTGIAASTEELVTTMQGGGQHNLGVIYTINPDGTQGGIAVNFDGTNGASPSGNLVQAGDQRVYGTTLAGGNNGFGVLFNYNPGTNQQQVVHHFNGVDGRAPQNLHLVGNVLYGTTSIGGTNTGVYSNNGMGVLYSYNIQTQAFSKLIDFNGDNGENPQGVIHGIDNNLYGLTRQGGSSGYGVLYRLNSANNTYTKLHDFSGVDGRTPSNCKLIQTSGNMLYGTTTWGGNNDMGVLFSFDMSHDMYTVLHHFDEATGRFPEGVLTEVNGVLYGITPYGGADGQGTAYSYNMSTGTYTVIHNFAEADGIIPSSGLTLGADGLLYGLTIKGGDYGNGVVFSINPVSNTYIVLAHNNAATGSNPLSTFLELAGNTTTGINDKAHNSLAVYPNPSANSINFNITGYDATDITITDISGSNVLESSFTPQLDISSLAAGTYFVQLSSDNANSIRTRIIKQ